MSRLDPEVLFKRLSQELPAELRAQLFVTGSLAAAYHFRANLEGRAVNTKDADVVVHPAGNSLAVQKMAEQLLLLGWTRLPRLCYPQPTPDPPDQLRAIRLYPPGAQDYFIEFLTLPEPDQRESRRWFPV